MFRPQLEEMQDSTAGTRFVTMDEGMDEDGVGDGGDLQLSSGDDSDDDNLDEDSSSGLDEGEGSDGSDDMEGAAASAGVVGSSSYDFSRDFYGSTK